jgi:hypothetical protein
VAKERWGKWILAVDSNSSFFHKCATGRRKMKIAMLEAEGSSYNKLLQAVVWRG